MRLLFIGCEWAGKHTLGIEVSRWWSEQTGESFLPPPHFSFHDHFVLPHVVHAMGHEHHKELSEKQMLTLNPGLLEHYQRYQIFNKLTPGYIDEPDLFLMDWYYGEAVYAPLYYGYGGPGEYADRRMLARWIDEDVLKLIPDTILVLIKASPEVIRERMAKGDSPFPRQAQGHILPGRGRRAGAGAVPGAVRGIPDPPQDGDRHHERQRRREPPGVHRPGRPLRHERRPAPHPDPPQHKHRLALALQRLFSGVDKTIDQSYTMSTAWEVAI